MVLCIEPMIMTDSDEYYVDPRNNWTVIASNHKLTCHWEHMVWVNKNEIVILTQ
jgi:methionyl aminopeptidase